MSYVEAVKKNWKDGKYQRIDKVAYLKGVEIAREPAEIPFDSNGFNRAEIAAYFHKLITAKNIMFDNSAHCEYYVSYEPVKN